MIAVKQTIFRTDQPGVTWPHSKARAPIALRNVAICLAVIDNRARLLESGHDTVGRLRYLEPPLNKERVIMKVVTLKDIPTVPLEGAERSQDGPGLFPGHVRLSFSQGSPRTIIAAW